ncbi:MAG: DUF58 domain-containing protein [Clostridia bacterium]|jgi:uncharacterized protein (DUF58 family)
MIATKRMVLLVWLGMIPLIAGMFLDVHITVFLLYNGILAGLYLLDRYISPSPNQFRLERIHEGRLEIGRDNRIGIRVVNTSKRRISLLIRDMVPEELADEYPALSLDCRPGTTEGYYLLRPRKRGNYRFGDLYGRYTGVMGLYMSQFRYPSKEDIPVYPNLQPLKKVRFTAHRQNLVEPGARAHRVMGLGTDFRGLREYSTDDEFRRINWNASARHHKLISNEYDVEKGQTLIIAMDTGRGMLGRSEGLSRLDHSIQSALVLAQAAVDKGDQVGLVVFGNAIKASLKPARGMVQVEKIIQTLYGLEAEFYESDYRELVSHLGIYQRKRALICLFTHIGDEERGKDLAAVLAPLRKKHSLLLISLQNPIFKGLVAAPVENLQHVYTKAAALYRLKTERDAGRILAGLGIPSISAVPQDLNLEVIQRYIAMKKQLRM